MEGGGRGVRCCAGRLNAIVGAEDTDKAVWEAIRIQAPAHPLLLRWGSDDVWGFWAEADGDVGRD